jgi:predicted ATPase/DNA-binding winged helix-turn-helix (wHTH) protein
LHPQHQRLRFGRFELLPVERQLLDSGRPVALGSRAFDVLWTLLQHRDRMLPKAELLDAVWPGLVVEEANLSVQVATLRKALGAAAIATIPGRGYRFALPVKEGGPALPTAAAVLDSEHNLSVPAEAMLGRDDDLDAAVQSLRVHRLVSVVGGGGVGKTRLAQAVAHAELASHPDGVWWTDLAAVAQPELIAPAIARAARLPLSPADGERSAVQLLARLLARRRTLLVLDNCEHLGADVAAVVRTLLEQAPGLRCLTTSQEPLRLAAEQVLPLQPLAVPPAGAPPAQLLASPAVQLLLRRAQAVDPRFRIDDAGLAAAAEICRRVDGNALAIEMAAARAPLLGLHAVHEQLARRLDFWHLTRRDALPRQQTLRATLDWSWSLLDTRQQVLLRRLSVFAGSFDLQVARQLAHLGPADGAADEAAALDALAGLVEKSLLQKESLQRPRYRLADTTRLYAAEQLHAAGEVEAATLGHGRALAALALHAQQQALPEDELLARHGPDYDDIAAAFERARERGDAETAAATVRLLRQLDQMRGMLWPSYARVEAAHALLSHAPALAQARLASFIVSCTWVVVAHTPRIDTARRAVSLWRELGDARELHHALARLASTCAGLGHHDEADVALQEAVAIEHADWPPQVRAVRHYHAGCAAFERGDARAYQAQMLQAKALFEQAGAPRLAALATDFLASAALMAGEVERAIDLAHECVAAVQALHQPAYLGTALCTLCDALMMAGDLPGARAAARRAWPLLERNGLLRLLLDELALLAALGGEAADGARLLGQADAQHRGADAARSRDEQRIADRAAALIDSALGPEAAACLREEGSRWTEPQALAVARSVLGHPPA